MEKNLIMGGIKGGNIIIFRGRNAGRESFWRPEKAWRVHRSLNTEGLVGL
jgi:hypothetical protein